MIVPDRNFARGLVCGLLFVLVAGCSSDPAPSATAAATLSRFPTLGSAVTRAPLPATWTPTPSPPPTASPTPTDTAPPAATLSAEAICERLVADIGITDGMTYSYFDPFLVVVDFDVPEASVDVRFVSDISGETRGFEVPPGGGGSFLLSFDQVLPDDGPYTWILSVNTAQYGRICERRGAFTIRALSPLRGEFGRLATWVAPEYALPTATPTATHTASPETTPETTPET